MHNNAYTWHDDYYEVQMGITTKYIDRHQTASMIRNPPSEYHPSKPWVLSCKQQITAIRKVCNVTNTMPLDKMFMFSP